MTATTDDLDGQYAVYEVGTAPFTPQERAAIQRYEEQTAGLVDSLDGVDAAGYRDYEGLFGRDETIELAKSAFTWLHRWHDALDVLHADLTDGRTLSVAAARMVSAEANAFFSRLNLARREVCAFLLGDAGPRPTVDAGQLALSNFPLVALDGTAVAEAVT